MVSAWGKDVVLNNPAHIEDCTVPCSLALRIMATTDLHMHLLPYDYVSDLPAPTVGLARTAGLIRDARKEAKNILLFDNGDFLHGTPMGDAITRGAISGQQDMDDIHPIVAAMTHLGYDAMSLGNHDFDHGLDYLGQVLDAVPFPVIASNLRILPDSNNPGPAPLPFAVPFSILSRDLTDDEGETHPLKIGLLGMLPPGLIPGLRGTSYQYDILDIIETAQRMVPQLRAMGADIVIVLAHSGIGVEQASPRLENAAIPLASVPGIDAIIAGHAHQVFPTPNGHWPQSVDAKTGFIHGVPVVSSGFWGSHLGVIDLTLERHTRDGWHVTQAQVEARPVIRRDTDTGTVIEEVTPHAEIVDRLEHVREAMVARVDQPVGETRKRLHSYFAALAPSPALDIVHRAMAWYGKRALKHSPWAGLPLLASTAPFKAGGLAGPGFYTDIPPGPLTQATISDLYLHPNDLCALRLTGAQLADWLERSASLFAQILPGGKDIPLWVPKAPAYGFESVAGVDFEIDLTVPPRHDPDGKLVNPDHRRVRNLTLNGHPVQPDEEVLMMTNSYRVTGGGGYPAPDPERIALDLPINIRDIIAEFVAKTGPFDTPPWASWRLAPVPGASATLVSSPQAEALIDELTGLDVQPMDREPDGFMRYRLML